MLGYVPQSKREKQLAEVDMRIRHHHYHCEQNPEGFLRLRCENIANDARKELRREWEELTVRKKTSS